jgi:hypothetical protein
MRCLQVVYTGVQRNYNGPRYSNIFASTFLPQNTMP